MGRGTDLWSAKDCLNLKQYELVLLKVMLVLVYPFTECRPAALKRQIALRLLAVNYLASYTMELVLCYCCCCCFITLKNNIEMEGDCCTSLLPFLCSKERRRACMVPPRLYPHNSAPKWRIPDPRSSSPLHG